MHRNFSPDSDVVETVCCNRFFYTRCSAEYSIAIREGMFAHLLGTDVQRVTLRIYVMVDIYMFLLCQQHITPCPQQTMKINTCCPAPQQRISVCGNTPAGAKHIYHSWTFEGLNCRPLLVVGLRRLRPPLTYWQIIHTCARFGVHTAICLWHISAAYCSQDMTAGALREWSHYLFALILPGHFGCKMIYSWYGTLFAITCVSIVGYHVYLESPHVFHVIHKAQKP